MRSIYLFRVKILFPPIMPPRCLSRKEFFFIPSIFFSILGGDHAASSDRETESNMLQHLYTKCYFFFSFSFAEFSYLICCTMYYKYIHMYNITAMNLIADVKLLLYQLHIHLKRSEGSIINKYKYCYDNYFLYYYDNIYITPKRSYKNE